MRGWVVNDPQGVHTIPTHFCVAVLWPVVGGPWLLEFGFVLGLGFR